MKKFLRLIIGLIICFTLVFVECTAANYDNYVYTADGFPFNEPTAYLPEEVLTGVDLGIGHFKEPQDIAVGNDGNIYILDTGNNRVVILSSQHKVVSVLKEFNIDGKTTELNDPQGLFVTQDKVLYIADSGNSRIVKFYIDTKECIEYKKPKISMLGDNYTYTPMKLTVDSAERMFVVAKAVTNGMIQLDADGSFSCFFGAIETTPTVLEIFWRRFMTKEQLARQETSIPTEYSNVNIDQNGFVYGTISATDLEEFTFSPTDTKRQFIRRMNPLGSDVLRRLGEYAPAGDVYVTLDAKGDKITSKMCDIAVLTDGIYSVLDSEKGRIFTYNNDGILLYVFGGLGEQLGLFNQPKALDVTKDNNYYVLDGGYNQVVVFSPTEYAQKIISASSKSFNMLYEESEEAWTEVMKYSTGSDIAYIGLGKALMRQGKYEEAKKYFEMGHSLDDFSEAFSKSRDSVIKNYFSIAMAVIAFAIVMYFVIKFIIRRRKGGHND
ncbi:MAG: hypothetical protein IKK24_01550 [Clostridia bacterium]|nr:hypothetical protein [Clostridia bacterium]